MTVQHLHPKLGAVDLVTAKEINEVMANRIDAHNREKYRTIKIARIIPYTITATGSTVNMFPVPPAQPSGPESGYIWKLRRVMIASNSITDTARYLIYRGSDQTYDAKHLVDGIVASAAGATQPVPAAPVVTASPYTYVNTNAYGVNVTVTGGTVTVIAVNGQTTGATSGTFYLLPDAYLTITYSSAPAVSAANATANTSATNAGQYVNVAYSPADRACWVFNDETIYAQITGATTGNQYTITGEAIQAAAERVGAII